MSILIDAIISSVQKNGYGKFKFNRISDEHKLLLKSITKRQRKKFFKYRLIPQQVLQIIWDIYLPEEKKPQEGMRVSIFLEFLLNRQYHSEKNRARGEWLHAKIEKEEFPIKDYSPEIFVKGEKGKFVSISYLRTITGTIFR